VVSIKEVRWCEIRADKTQSRAKIDPETVHDYADLLRDGVPLPPLIVFFDSEYYWLADGFHRHAAYGNLGSETCPCDVNLGTERDALLYSVGANCEHGLRRTNDDKRHAVELLLADREWSQWSNVMISEKCGVSDWLVADVRRMLQVREPRTTTETNGKTRVGRDGKRQAATKKKPEPPAEPEPDDTSFDPAAIEAEPTVRVDIKALAAPYREAVRSIGKILAEFERLALDEKTGAHLSDKIVRLRHELNEAKGTINQAEPVRECPKCEGAGCRSCANTGFWTRAIAGFRKGA
jgi:hypothetical protein